MAASTNLGSGFWPYDIRIEVRGLMMSGHRFEMLDGLRGIAALAVVCTHSWILVGHTIVPHGYLAVDFFFALSGFVLAYAYEKRLQNGLSAKRFAYARIIRLYPMIIAGVFLGAVSSAVFAQPSWTHLSIAVVLQILTVPSPRFPDVGFGLWPLNAPVWSLFWEFLANAVFALWAFRQSTRRLAVIAAVGAAALVAIVVLKGTLETGWTERGFLGGLARVMFSFTAGHILYRLFASGRLASLPVPGGLLALITALVFFVPADLSPGLVDLILTLLVFPVVLVAGAQNTSTGRSWDWLGRLSYPLYLVHYPIMIGFAAIPAVTDVQRWMVQVSFVACAICAAFLVLVFYDEPVRRALSARFRQRSRPPSLRADLSAQPDSGAVR